MLVWIGLGVVVCWGWCLGNVVFVGGVWKLVYVVGG